MMMAADSTTTETDVEYAVSSIILCDREDRDHSRVKKGAKNLSPRRTWLAERW